jgi:hypothetical protein
MMPVSYLIAVTTTQPGLESVIAVFNIAGRGQPVYGFSFGGIHTNLWIIPKGKGSRQEVITKLQAVPAIGSVSVVALSNPVQQTELAAIRQLFTDIGWDASGVSDDALSEFMNAILKGQNRFYIDYNRREKTPVRIQIKPIEEHPLFSPDWLNAGITTDDEEPDREYTPDDFEIRNIIIEKRVEVLLPPPPPDRK